MSALLFDGREISMEIRRGYYGDLYVEYMVNEIVFDGTSAFHKTLHEKMPLRLGSKNMSKSG